MPIIKVPITKENFNMFQSPEYATKSADDLAHDLKERFGNRFTLKQIKNAMSVYFSIIKLAIENKRAVNVLQLIELETKIPMGVFLKRYRSEKLNKSDQRQDRIQP